MTAQDPAQREGAAAQGAMLCKRFFRIARAARVEATVRPKQGAHAAAVQTDQRYQHDAHCLITVHQCFSRLRTMDALSASRAPERALTTISTAGSSCWCCRNDSRTSRLMRLRRTALPMTRAAIESPRRGMPPSLLRVKIANEPSAERRASRYTRSNSDLALRRCAGLNGRAVACKSMIGGMRPGGPGFRRSGAYALSRGGEQAPDVRRG